jgi:hypothetical protein
MVTSLNIVERLRAMPSSLNDALRTMDEAADRIEALETALREIIAIGDASSGSDWNDLVLSRDIARAAHACSFQEIGE